MKTSIKHLLLVAAVLCSLVACAASPTYHIQSMVMFLDHKGGDLNIDFNAFHSKKKPDPNPRAQNIPAVLLTVYNPQEKVVKDVYWYDEAWSGKFHQEILLPKAEAGIWQLRITAEHTSKPGYTVTTTPDCPHGIMPSRCWVWFHDTKHFSKCYFYVPDQQARPADGFVYNGELTISDLDGKELLKLDKKKTSGSIKLTGGQVYRQTYKTNSPGWNWFGFGRFPVIYCKTPELARRLHASTLPVPGTDRTVPLKCQQNIEAWKATLKPEDLYVPEIKLSDYKKEFLAHPESRWLLGLTGVLSGAPYLIKKQHVDPKDPLFGYGLRGTNMLTLLYLLDKPYNPYYKMPAIKNRVLLYCLNKMSRQQPLHENGSLEETHSNYAGADGMFLVSDYKSFLLLSPHLTEQERTLWGDALGYPVRRFFCDRVSCENQSAHWPVKLYAYGKATNNPLFVRMAKDYINNLSDPERDIFIRTGYLQEAYGPDATYQGLCTALLAHYYYFSKDPKAKALIDKIYTLFNHTVAPEPDGIAHFGGCGFSHRTMGGWYVRQYAGGTATMANALESAACWHQKPDRPWTEKDFDQWLNWPANYDPYPHYASWGYSTFSNYWSHFPKNTPIPHAKFPAQTMAPGEVRNVNEEFYFCRQPDYYLAIYTGQTGWKQPTWLTVNKPAFNWKPDKDGTMIAKTRKIRAALQGPQLFWTPDYGVALLSMNWNVYTFWSSWVRNPDGTCELPSYWKTKMEKKPQDNLISFLLEMPQAETQIARDIRFDTDALYVSCKLVAPGKDGRQWIEQLPFPIKQGQVIQYQNGTQWQQDIPEKATAVRMVNAAKSGVLITFSRPVSLVRQKDFKDLAKSVSSLSIELGDTRTAPRTFSYTVRSIKVK